MHRKKCQAGPQAGVKPHRREHRATAGTDAHLFSFADLVALAVFERKVQCRRAAQRRREAPALLSGVVRIQVPPRRQADGIFLVQLIHRRLEFDDAERGARANQRFAPQPAVQIEFARMRLIVAGPLNAAEFLKTLVTHARMHRTQRTQLVPNRLRIRFAPIAAKPLRQFVDDFHVVAHVVGQRHGGAHALHAALAARHRAFGFTPPGGAGQDDMGEFRRLRIKEVLHHKEFEPAYEFHGAVTVRFGIDRVFAENVESREFVPLHRFKHFAQMQAAFGIDLRSVGAFKFRAQLRILHVLKARQAVGNRAHVAAALHVVLPAQRIYAAPVAPDVSGQQGQVNQRQHVVHGVVMLGDAQGPANLRALCFGIGVRGLANHFGGHTGLEFGTLQRVFFDASPVSVKSAGRVSYELLVGQAGMNHLPGHGVGQANIAAHVEPKPRVRPLRGARPARIDHIELRAVADSFQHMMEKDRMRLARVRAPKQDHVGLFDFAVRARPAARSEHCRQTDDARRVSSPVAAVDVVGADDLAGELLGDVVELIGGLGAAEEAEAAGTGRAELALDALSRPIERFLPARRPQLALRADQRLGQPACVHGSQSRWRAAGR